MVSNKMWLLRIAQRLAREGFFGTDDGRNIASADLLDVFPFVGVHPHQAADALAPVAVGVDDRLAGNSLPE